jgi:hypothetical protein
VTESLKIGILGYGPAADGAVMGVICTSSKRGKPREPGQTRSPDASSALPQVEDETHRACAVHLEKSISTALLHPRPLWRTTN